MTRTPWHFWPIVIFGLLWHCLSCFDYVVTQYGWTPWMELATPEQRAFLDIMPNWIDGAWGATVWLGLFGVGLMAFRTALAPLMLGISTLAILAATIGLSVSTPTLFDLAGWPGVWVMLGSCLGAALLWLYARAMHKAGVID